MSTAKRYFALRNVLLFGASVGSAFSPAELFAASEQGVWYDPSDLSTMFQDAAGTTAVTAVEQPVGLILDKSGRGNHASQSTTTARPVLSARVNLLRYSEQFDNAAWVKEGGATITADQGIDPLGGSSADKFTAGTGRNISQQYIATTNGVNYTFTVWIKGVSEGGTCGLYFSNPQLTPTNGMTATFTTSWQKFTLTGNATSASTYVNIGTWGNLGNGPTKDILIWGADLRVTNAGTNLPAYQRVGAATSGSSSSAGNGDYDTSGFPLYLRFDGTDDSLVTATINPGSVDKAQVFAGARNLSDASAGIVAELSASLTANSGAFYLVAGNNGTTGWTSSARGSATIGSGQAAGYAVAAPNTAVICATYDISGDLNAIRMNGSAGTSGTAGQGTGNFGSYPLYIGRRGSTTLPFSGHLYGLIARFSAANLSAVQIASAEAWLNQKAKAY